MTTITVQFDDGRTKTLYQPEIRSRLLATVGLIAFVVALSVFPFRRLINEHYDAALRPAMEHIADHGGGAADMWLFSHFDERGRLPAAAAAGNAEALYLQGNLLMYRGQHRAGLRMIQRSAAQGYPCAVVEQESRHTWKWKLTHHVCGL